MRIAKTRPAARILAVAAGATLLGTTATTAAPASAASDGDVEVVNTETVQAYTDASGAVQSKRIYEQLALTGSGPVDLTNPIVTDGLRNLDGFGGFDVENGEQVVHVDVDGEENLRSVSDYDGDLPLEIHASYALDGKDIDPGDLVGESGDLTVTYTVKNVTQEMQTISFADGKGGTMSREVEVMMPMVGSLTTTLPSSFRDVTSDANMAGDGEGGTRLSFTMTLLAPLGSDTAKLSYTAHVVDAVVPDAEISALPVNPLRSPNFKTAGESYQGGATTGEELANGAATIDENLLKLRDGAAKLLAGMIQLRDGAGKLNEGLADTAVPGAMKLAAGADELHTGMGRLYDGTVELTDGSDRLSEGAGQVADGADQVSDGSQRAYEGSQELTHGLGLISGGLDTLAGRLPAAEEGIKALQAGVDLIHAGLGDPGNAETLIGGLTKLQSGLTTLKNGQGTVVGGLQQLAGADGLAKIRGGAALLKDKLDGAAPVVGGSLDKLIALADALKTDPGCTGSCQVTAAQLSGGLALLKGSLGTQLGEASGGMAQIVGGLDAAIAALTGRLIPGANLIYGGLGTAEQGAGQAAAGAQKLQEGVGQVGDGLDALGTGLTAAVGGVLQLADGAGTAYDGSGQLTDGLAQLSDGSTRLADGAGQVADGAGRLADGAGQLRDGTGKALDGAGQIADGNEQLADGLGDAADGSGLLFDGLVKAALGVPKIRDGAQELSDRGTSKLVDAGLSTAQQYGLMYAMMEAGGKRADDEKMVVGAPDGAIGLAAYSYQIQGEDGEGGRNATRGLAGLAVLGAGAAAFAVRRRFV